MEIDQVDPYLTSSVLDLENPAPPNPDGVAKLNEALKVIQQPPPAQPVPALPEMAATVSGNTYLFEPNATDIKTFRLDFDDSAEAKIEITFDDTEEKYSGLLGLDGVFRMTRARTDCRPAYAGNGPMPTHSPWRSKRSPIARHSSMCSNSIIRSQWKLGSVPTNPV